MSQLKESLHLRIPLKDIQIATKHFDESQCIGKGGYGRVYKGELIISGKQTTVAVKRLNENLGQGSKEFLTEIQLLSRQMHPNLISLLGYCDEGKEKIIVYEYAECGSLDRYIKHSNTTDHALTWLERLKICLDAARGLEYLHNHVGTHQSVIHRDIKSANILIDQNRVAKISDLGLSTLSLTGLNNGSAVITRACGTPGYCEPEYAITGVVKKESDIYLFGMVLFEVLCGRLVNFEEDNGLLLSATLVKEYYEGNKLDDIVDPRLKNQLSLGSLLKFSKIAYQCLSNDREQRPPINLVVKELEELVNIYQVVRFRSLNKMPEEDEFSLEFHRSEQHDYDNVVESVARHLNVDDPSKIRLTSQNCYSHRPKRMPITYRGVAHLSDMLTDNNQTSDVLYYEVLDIPLPEMERLKTLQVAFHHAITDEVVIHTVRLEKESIVRDLINDLKTKVELSKNDAELRLLEVSFHKIYKMFPLDEKIGNINDQHWTIRAEEIPEEENNLGPHDLLIRVYHFMKGATPTQFHSFGEPFLFVIHEGETLAEVKVRIKNKLRVPDEEFSKWKFAFMSLGDLKYLQDSDIVTSLFQRSEIYRTWFQYLGLEHPFINSSQSSYAARHFPGGHPSLDCSRPNTLNYRVLNYKNCYVFSPKYVVSFKAKLTNTPNAPAGFVEEGAPSKTSYVPHSSAPSKDEVNILREQIKKLKQEIIALKAREAESSRKIETLQQMINFLGRQLERVEQDIKESKTREEATRKEIRDMTAMFERLVLSHAPAST